LPSRGRSGTWYVDAPCDGACSGDDCTLPGQGEPIGSPPVSYFDAAGYLSNPVSGITATPASAGTVTLDACEGRESGHCGKSESCHRTKSLCDSCGCGLALSAVHPFAALSSFWCRFLPCLPASRRRPGGERREPWLCDPSRPIPTERSVAAGNTRSAMLVCSVSAAPPSRGGAGPTAARGVRTSGSGH
jgi:hypothetical protein